jgi:hypothetical protein
VPTFARMLKNKKKSPKKQDICVANIAFRGISFYFLLFGKEEAGEKEGDNCFLSIYLDSSNCVEKFCDSWV